MHTNGRWIGKPFRLLPWQKRLLLALFELEPDGLRRYRWALIGVPKKNGKTELAAALGLYFLIGDNEPAPLVVCAAAAEDQADLVFAAASTMCKMSPTLSKIAQVFEREITVPSLPGAKLKRVAAVSGTNDGQNIHVVICDELHEWVLPKHEATWNVLTNGSGARQQPMVLQISTAGYDLESVCGRQYLFGKRVAEDAEVDRRFYFYWVEAPEGARHDDPATWEAANPSYGVLVHESFFRDQLTKKTESVFRRYFCNQWTESEEAWVTPDAWDACEAPNLELSPKLPLYVMLDLGLKHDSSAGVLAQRVGDRVVVRAKVWENPYPPDHSAHDGWKLDIAAVETWLVELFTEYPEPAAEVDDEVKPGPAFFYDPWAFERSAQVLEGRGLNMIEFPQYDSLMAPASQALFQAISEGKLAHDGNDDLRRHILNATVKETDRGFRITRPKGARGKSRKKIDAAVACAGAVWKAVQTPTPGQNRKPRTFRTF